MKEIINKEAFEKCLKELDVTSRRFKFRYLQYAWLAAEEAMVKKQAEVRCDNCHWSYRDEEDLCCSSLEKENLDRVSKDFYCKYFKNKDK